MLDWSADDQPAGGTNQKSDQSLADSTPEETRVFNAEQMQEQEQEQEQEKEQEQEEEVQEEEVEEPETYGKKRYSTKKQEKRPWGVDALKDGPAGLKNAFYPCSQFSLYPDTLFTNGDKPIKFPDMMMVSGK